MELAMIDTSSLLPRAGLKRNCPAQPQELKKSKIVQYSIITV